MFLKQIYRFAFIFNRLSSAQFQIINSLRTMASKPAAEFPKTLQEFGYAFNEGKFNNNPTTKIEELFCFAAVFLLINFF